MKNNRISFRISDELDRHINELVRNNNQIKSRSDFGSKALEFYLSHLLSREDELKLMKRAILALAKGLIISPEISP